MTPNRPATPRPDVSNADRRAFLHKAAKVGVVTPAAVTLLLAAGSRRAEAGRNMKYICDYPPCPSCSPCATCEAYLECEE